MAAKQNTAYTGKDVWLQMPDSANLNAKVFEENVKRHEHAIWMLHRALRTCIRELSNYPERASTAIYGIQDLAATIDYMEQNKPTMAAVVEVQMTHNEEKKTKKK